ncbi:MAG: hypothetical protein JSR54_14080 [Proteobacteria bacterium]|nr:hypothetical protein [Pseudomonadota bacterium]
MNARWLLVMAAGWLAGPAGAADPAPDAAARAAAADVVQAEPAAGQPAGPAKAAKAPKAARSAGGAAASPADKSGKAMDRLELETSQITGNRELPKVMVIVPWKRSDIGDLVGRPVNSLVDEALQPVDREVFRREIDYFDALAPDRARGETRVTSGATTTRPEK